MLTKQSQGASANVEISARGSSMLVVGHMSTELSLPQTYLPPAINSNITQQKSNTAIKSAGEENLRHKASGVGGFSWWISDYLIMFGGSLNCPERATVEQVYVETRSKLTTICQFQIVPKKEHVGWWSQNLSKNMTRTSSYSVTVNLCCSVWHRF